MIKNKKGADRFMLELFLLLILAVVGLLLFVPWYNENFGKGKKGLSEAGDTALSGFQAAKKSFDQLSVEEQEALTPEKKEQSQLEQLRNYIKEGDFGNEFKDQRVRGLHEQITSKTVTLEGVNEAQQLFERWVAGKKAYDELNKERQTVTTSLESKNYGNPVYNLYNKGATNFLAGRYQQAIGEFNQFISKANSFISANQDLNVDQKKEIYRQIGQAHLFVARSYYEMRSCAPLDGVYNIIKSFSDTIQNQFNFVLVAEEASEGEEKGQELEVAVLFYEVRCYKNSKGGEEKAFNIFETIKKNYKTGILSTISLSDVPDNYYKSITVDCSIYSDYNTCMVNRPNRFPSDIVRQYPHLGCWWSYDDADHCASCETIKSCPEYKQGLGSGWKEVCELDSCGTAGLGYRCRVDEGYIVDDCLREKVTSRIT